MSVKKIAYLGIGIALYMVLGLVMNIPLLAGSHIQTDLGYIAFGAFCFLFGWEACIVGIIGCFIESLIVSGWVPVGWMLGQLFIGVVCGIAYKKFNQRWVQIAVTIIAVFIGIGIIKTAVECVLYSIPVLVKFPKNFVAFIADVIPMIVGLFIGVMLKSRLKLEEG